MRRQKSKVKKSNSKASALIICNGKLEKATVNKLIDIKEPRQHVIAADGASDFLYRHRIIPDIIIGDLDSISPAAEKYFKSKKVKLKLIFDQNRNDLEKCLGYAISKKIKNISITGFSGKRFDHSINNLSILKKYYRNAGIKVFDQGFVYYFIHKKTEFTCKPGDIISLIALPKAAGITTTGLKYPLKNGTLEFGAREGALNEAVSGKVEIKFTGGDLLVMKTYNP